MQVKLIALAIAAMAATPAFAQSNVKIYGSLDALFATFSNDGAGTNMDDSTHKTSRLGFQGSEDLGGGMKAFFQLEERFSLDTSTADGKWRFKDKAWVGLSGGFGAVSFGRVPTALDIIYGGGKAANVDTIADWGSRKGQSDGRVDNGISYTSPKLGPVTLYAHTGLKEASKAPTPYGVSMNATFGPAFVEVGYQKDGAGDGSDDNGVEPSTSGNAFDPLDQYSNQYKTILLNGGFKFSNASVYAAFSRSKGYRQDGQGVDPRRKFTRFAVGADMKVTSAGSVYATLGQLKEDNAAGVAQPTYTKLGLAYVHSLSKRTQLVGATSFERKSNAYMGSSTRYGVQAGLRHAF